MRRNLFLRLSLSLLCLPSPLLLLAPLLGCGSALLSLLLLLLLLALALHLLSDRVVCAVPGLRHRLGWFTMCPTPLILLVFAAERMARTSPEKVFLAASGVVPVMRFTWLQHARPGRIGLGTLRTPAGFARLQPHLCADFGWQSGARHFCTWYPHVEVGAVGADKATGRASEHRGVYRKKSNPRK